MQLEEGDAEADDGVGAEAAREDFVHGTLGEEGFGDHDEGSEGGAWV